MKLRTSRQGAELSLNMMITGIIVLVILVLIILILANYGGPLLNTLKERVNSAIGLSQSVRNP